MFDPTRPPEDRSISQASSSVEPLEIGVLNTLSQDAARFNPNKLAVIYDKVQHITINYN
jgi:hypothetical protein